MSFFTIILADGVYPGTSRADYDAIDAVSQSRLKPLRRTPAHCRWEIDNEREPSEAMEFGTAFHCGLLEPGRFELSYCVTPKFDRRTKDGKAAAAIFEQMNAGRQVIDVDDSEAIKAMQDSIADHPTAGPLLSGRGLNEVCIVWTDAASGLRCKGLLDRITTYDGWTVIVDLKSCEDASPAAFARDAARYGYHVQAAYYLDGLNALQPCPRRFLFVAVEKQPPYCVAVYELDTLAIDAGRRKYQDWLSTYAECERQNTWPGYESVVTPLSLPKWETA